jgi:tetrahydromethanopterin S-methyltransferase subunit G
MQQKAQKLSLPIALRMSLKQHAMASDIAQDDELEEIVEKLDALNEKIEAIKEKALAKRASRG